MPLQSGQLKSHFYPTRFMVDMYQLLVKCRLIDLNLFHTNECEIREICCTRKSGLLTENEINRVFFYCNIFQNVREHHRTSNLVHIRKFKFVNNLNLEIASHGIMCQPTRDD